jgi:NAD-dependent deacetylase
VPGHSSDIARAAEVLSRAESLVVSTGAGMSKESGVPTFRDAPNALWAKYDPQELATPEGFLRNPSLVWQWYAERRRMISAVKPHAGHFAVAEMEALFPSFMLLTQNIDNLHREAGSEKLVELHGNIFRYKCFDRHHAIDVLPESNEVPPRCSCGSPIRPDVVWFGEMLPEGALDLAYARLATCDALLVVGTSGTVHPAAGFPSFAKQCGARVIEINPEPTELTADADVFITSTAGRALPELVASLKRSLEQGTRS